jgi:hypothetical protein
MKKTIKNIGTFIGVLLLASGCCTSGTSNRRVAYNATNQTTDGSFPGITLIRISAEVDGSDCFKFTNHGVKYEHKFWSPPSDVKFNGEPWPDLDHMPAGWVDLSKQLDLPKAWIVRRQGRDIIALENTVEGFDLYLCDSPNGSAHYEVTIAVPMRIKSPPHTAAQLKATTHPMTD